MPNEMRIVCFVLVGLAKTDVALDRLRTDFQFLRKFSAIRITARFKTFMHTHHAFERRAGVETSMAAGRELGTIALHSIGLQRE